MRKSLLITSALGLVSALPTFAMANAAGSTAAACASGFFAQIDAKIMNAKLEIKNEKGSKSTLPAEEEEDANKISDALANDVIAKLKASTPEALFNDAGTEGSKGAFLGNIFTKALVENLRGKDRAGVLAEIAKVEGIVAPTDAASRLALARVGTRELMAAGATDADVTKALNNLADDLIKLVDNFAPSAKGVINDATLNNFADILRGVSAIATANDVTDVVNLTRGRYYFKGNKLYIINAANNNIDQAFLTAFKTRLDANLDFSTTPATLNTLKASVNLAEYARVQAEENVKLNASLKERKKLEVIDRRVHHHALAGGVGATAGWWQNMGGFALSISGTGDYLWGTFRTVDDASGSSMKAEDKKKLGFGFQGDVGVHYVVSPSTTLGVLVGFRGQQLQFGRTDKTPTPGSKDSKGDYASKWMWNPVVSGQARTFFTDTVYGALTVGYVIPMSERDYKLENTKIDKDAKVRFQGLTGAFSVGMMF